jgi:hypothetical protein
LPQNELHHFSALDGASQHALQTGPVETEALLRLRVAVELLKEVPETGVVGPANEVLDLLDAVDINIPEAQHVGGQIVAAKSLVSISVDAQIPKAAQVPAWLLRSSGPWSRAGPRRVERENVSRPVRVPLGLPLHEQGCQLLGSLER